MVFQQEFTKGIDNFPSLEGLIFVDPDGEAILFESPQVDPFHLKLAGAKMPILMAHYSAIGIKKQPLFFELQFEGRFVISVSLVDHYSITAIGNDPAKRGQIKKYLARLSHKFNRELC